MVVEPEDDDTGLPKPGDLLGGKFRIEALIGRGGMGAVFSAQHEMLGQRVAIKMLLSAVASNREAVARFLNEARAAARIEGEHVARVMDVATLDDGRPYMVIEYLDGSDLSQHLEARGPLPVREAVDHILQALEALAQAHARGIVHRDFKPSNLFLARRLDGTTLVKVLDFGIAKATQPQTFQESASVTRSNAILGSPQYMSPEQLRNPRNVDARTDIWAVGLTLYELLTGSAPFSGRTFGELFAAILEETAPPIRAQRPDVDPELEAIIARCLCRDVNQRYPNVTELAQVLARHGSPRAAFSVERIVSVLPPPLVPLPSATGAAALGKDQAPGVSRAAGPYGAAHSGAEPAERTAPPLSSTRSPALASTALASSGKKKGLVWIAGAGVAVILAVFAGIVERTGSHETSNAADSASAPSSRVSPMSSSSSSITADSLSPARASSSPSAASVAPAMPPAVVSLAPSPPVAPRPSAVSNGLSTAPSPPVASVRATSSTPMDASADTPPSKSKTRVDQNGLAGENPFR